MAEGKSKQYPYRTLGFKLRSLREKENETIPDVSGAVEIDSELLVEIEQGLKLPSEDILLLLISHFGLLNEDAMKLWRLAGYDNLSDNTSLANSENLSHQSAVFLLPIDSRVVYTDLVQVNVNNYGIVINFQQTNTQSNSQPLTVARVGMSREHAENVISILQQVLTDKPKKSRKLIDQRKNKKQGDKNKWLGSQDS
jgi:hypothetical protein